MILRYSDVEEKRGPRRSSWEASRWCLIDPTLRCLCSTFMTFPSLLWLMVSLCSECRVSYRHLRSELHICKFCRPLSKHCAEFPRSRWLVAKIQDDFLYSWSRWVSNCTSLIHLVNHSRMQVRQEWLFAYVSARLQHGYYSAISWESCFVFIDNVDGHHQDW